MMRKNIILAMILIPAICLAISPIQYAEGAVKLQLALVLDGSGSISGSDWSIIVNGVADAITNPSCMPQDGTVELTVVQFGSMVAIPEIPPTVITADNINIVAGLIRIIPQIGGSTPMASGIHVAAYAMANSENFDPAIKQAINLATDGDPNVCDPAFSCEILDPDRWICHHRYTGMDGREVEFSGPNSQFPCLIPGTL